MGFFRKLPDRPPEGTSVAYELKRNKMFGLRDVIICVVIVGIFLISRNGFGLGLGSYGGLLPVMEEERFGITGLDGTTHFFSYTDSCELRDDLKSFDMGEKIEGQENRQVRSGTYRNSEFGEYQLHVQTKLHCYIVVHAPDGVIVFNLESDDTTKELHRYFNQLKDEQLSGTKTE